MRFADIPGHDDIKSRLRLMADSGRIPHALLFEGPSGSAKFMLARAFAQYIHCLSRTPDGDSCGHCTACRQHQSFNHIDTLYSFPVVKKGGKATISDDYADDFREFITAQPFMDFDGWLIKLDNIGAQPQIYVEEGNELNRRLSFMTRSSNYKIVLMWLPERMVQATANKLLKLIEEPSGDTIFLMASNNSRLILPTIYSRTQRINVIRYTDDELKGILLDKGIEADLADDLVRQAEGNVNLALRLAGDSADRDKYFDLFKDLMRKAYGRKVGELRQWSIDVAAMGRESSMRFIDFCTRLIRESFIMHLHIDGLLTVSSEENAFLEKFYPFINEKNVADMIDQFDLCRRDIAGNGNAKIIFFDLAVRIIMLLRRK